MPDSIVERIEKLEAEIFTGKPSTYMVICYSEMRTDLDAGGVAEQQPIIQACGAIEHARAIASAHLLAYNHQHAVVVKTVTAEEVFNVIPEEEQ